MNLKSAIDSFKIFGFVIRSFRFKTTLFFGRGKRQRFNEAEKEEESGAIKGRKEKT